MSGVTDPRAKSGWLRVRVCLSFNMSNSFQKLTAAIPAGGACIESLLDALHNDLLQLLLKRSFRHASSFLADSSSSNRNWNCC